MSNVDNVVDLTKIIKERNQDWDDEFTDYITHMLVDEFVEAWEFSDCDEKYMKQFARDMSIIREDLMAVVKRLNGEHHDQHEFMDEYWSMLDKEYNKLENETNLEL